MKKMKRQKPVLTTDEILSASRYGEQRVTDLAEYLSGDTTETADDWAVGIEKEERERFYEERDAHLTVTHDYVGKRASLKRRLAWQEIALGSMLDHGAAAHAHRMARVARAMGQAASAHRQLESTIKLLLNEARCARNVFEVASSKKVAEIEHVIEIMATASERLQSVRWQALRVISK